MRGIYIFLGNSKVDSVRSITYELQPMAMNSDVSRSGRRSAALGESFHRGFWALKDDSIQKLLDPSLREIFALATKHPKNATMPSIVPKIEKNRPIWENNVCNIAVSVYQEPFHCVILNQWMVKSKHEATVRRVCERILSLNKEYRYSQTFAMGRLLRHSSY